MSAWAFSFCDSCHTETWPDILNWRFRVIDVVSKALTG